MTAAGAGTPSPPDVLPLEGLPPPLFPATPSKLGAWLDCPRKYRFTYVDRPAPTKGPPWAHNSFGASVHNALRSWYGLLPGRRTRQAARDLVEAGWISDGFRDDEQSARARARAADITARYVDTLDPNDEPAGVERSVAGRFGTIALQGRVDRIDDLGDELVIVDYKTGHRELTQLDVRGSLALAAYALATARTLRRICHRVELHHLPTGAVHVHEHTEESLQRHLGRAEAVVAEIRSAADYPARPGPLCGFCDFVRVCAEGSAATRPRASWEGLGPDA